MSVPRVADDRERLVRQFLHLIESTDKSPADVDLHLRGEKQIMTWVNVRGGCTFGAIIPNREDIFDAVAMAQRVIELKLPLLVTRTKSGAGMLWYFGPMEPVGAMRWMLTRYATQLALEQYEIFPAPQPQIIGAPYFGSDEVEFIASGGISTFEQFVEHAHALSRRNEGKDEHGNWYEFTDPQWVDAEQAAPEVTDSSAAHILARHWKVGDLDVIGFAVANILYNRGWPDSRINALIDLIAVYAVEDKADKADKTPKADRAKRAPA